MPMKIVNEFNRTLSSSEKELIGCLMNERNLIDADLIITKLIINGWPCDWIDANRCIETDRFCYNHAINGKCNLQNCRRVHGDDYNIMRLFGNGKNNNVRDIGRKRRAFYLAYYLFKYCSFKYSKQFAPKLQQIENIIKHDKDYQSFLIKYKNSWFVNITYDDNGRRSGVDYKYCIDNIANDEDNIDCMTECTEFTQISDYSNEYEQYDKYDKYTEDGTQYTEATISSTRTEVSLFSDDFYTEWEDVMKVYNNGKDFYFSV